MNRGAIGILFSLMVVSVLSCNPSDRLAPLCTELSQYVEKIDGKVGIAVLTDEGDSLTIHNEVHYPLMSVFKFHQALAVADYLAYHHIPLDSNIYIPSESLQLDTYSPLRERYPNGNIALTIGELLEYTLQWSDNLACDILFEQFYSASQTDSLLRKLTDISDFRITYNETQMHNDFRLSYDNWTTPFAMVQLIYHFLNDAIVAEPYATFIKHTMEHCETGQSRLAMPILTNGGVIGHKTGSGFRLENGAMSAINDVGYVVTPSGKRYAIAVFVKDSKSSMEEVEYAIAHISTMVYDFLK